WKRRFRFSRNSFSRPQLSRWCIIPAQTRSSPAGTPNSQHGRLRGLLDGFDPSLHFTEYLDDPTKLPDGAQLCKVAGQVCYMSFGPRRTFNEHAERYFNNLKSAGHGSV